MITTMLCIDGKFFLIMLLRCMTAESVVRNSRQRNLCGLSWAKLFQNWILCIAMKIIWSLSKQTNAIKFFKSNWFSGSYSKTLFTSLILCQMFSCELLEVFRRSVFKNTCKEVLLTELLMKYLCTESHLPRRHRK